MDISSRASNFNMESRTLIIYKVGRKFSWISDQTRISLFFFFQLLFQTSKLSVHGKLQVFHKWGPMFYQCTGAVENIRFTALNTSFRFYWCLILIQIISWGSINLNLFYPFCLLSVFDIIYKTSRCSSDFSESAEPGSKYITSLKYYLI